MQHSCYFTHKCKLEMIKRITGVNRNATGLEVLLNGIVWRFRLGGGGSLLRVARTTVIKLDYCLHCAVIASADSQDTGHRLRDTAITSLLCSHIH